MKTRHLFLVCLLAAGTAWGSDDKEEASRLLRKTVDGVLSVVRDKSLGTPQKKDKVMEWVRPVFDFDLMAKLTLGRTHWPKLTAAQKRRFTDLFIKQLQNSYLDKVELVADEKVEYDEPVEKDKKVYLLTRVVTKTEPIRLAYRFYRSKGGLKVYDVEIQDVSLVKSYGLQYQEILRQGTPEDLLRKMQEKIDQLDKEAAKPPRQ